MAKARSRQRSHGSTASSGFDPEVANQLTALTLTGAINQQALNATAARNHMGAMATAMTLNVQLTQLAGLRMAFGLSPLDASAAAMMQAAASPQQAADLNAAAASPSGI